MNPTHEPDNNAAQPRAFGADFLADLLTDKDRFRAGIAPAETDSVGYVLTDAGREALAQVTAGVNGRRAIDPALMSDAEFAAWGDERDGELAADYGDRQRDTYLGQQEAADVRCQDAPGTVGDVLRSAALYLERHGWIQGAYYDMTATVFTPGADLVGAIAMVCYGGPCEAPAQHFADPGFLDFEEAVLHLDRYLLVENSSESYEFNDAPGRRADDVIAVLRKAAARPAEELLDALKVIDAKNADMAALVELILPSGVFGEQADSSQTAAWNDGDSDGGDVE